MIDLKKYCSVGDSRSYLNSPFTVAGLGYAACDGAIFVCWRAEVGTPTGLPDDFLLRAHQLAADAKALFKTGFGVDSTAISSIEFPPPTPCEHCEGTGKQPATEDCDECDGEGEFHYGSHYYECKDCDGDGKVIAPLKEKVACERCQGTGNDCDQPIKVGSAHFSRKYLTLLRDLPDCRLYPGKATETAFFQFEGGWGVLMPFHPIRGGAE